MTEQQVHQFDVRVYYEDTDAAGIVYYANYLRFAERARTEMLRVAGIDHGALRDRDGSVFAVRRCNTEYLSPARLDDKLCVHSTIDHIGGASLDMHQVICRDRQKLCDMAVKLVYVHVTGERTGKSSRIPDHVRNAMMSFTV